MVTGGIRGVGGTMIVHMSYLCDKAKFEYSSARLLDCRFHFGDM